MLLRTHAAIPRKSRFHVGPNHATEAIWMIQHSPVNSPVGVPFDLREGMFHQQCVGPEGADHGAAVFPHLHRLGWTQPTYRIHTTAVMDDASEARCTRDAAILAAHEKSGPRSGVVTQGVNFKMLAADLMEEATLNRVSNCMVALLDKYSDFHLPDMLPRGSGLDRMGLVSLLQSMRGSQVAMLVVLTDAKACVRAGMSPGESITIQQVTLDGPLFTGVGGRVTLEGSRYKTVSVATAGGLPCGHIVSKPSDSRSWSSARVIVYVVGGSTEGGVDWSSPAVFTAARRLLPICSAHKDRHRTWSSIPVGSLQRGGAGDDAGGSVDGCCCRGGV